MSSGRSGTQVPQPPMWSAVGTAPLTVGAAGTAGVAGASVIEAAMIESFCGIGMPCIDGALTPCIRNSPASTVNSSITCRRPVPVAIVPPARYQLPV